MTRIRLAFSALAVAAVGIVPSCAMAAAGTVASRDSLLAQQPKLAIRTIQQVSMVTPSFGYGLFESSGAGVCEVVVGKTSNAGRTFNSQVVVERWRCGNGAYGGSELTSDRFGDVFVWGHGLWVSNNDGSTWTAVPHVGHVLDVSSLDGSLWLVTALCPSSRTYLCPMRVEASSDHGRSWVEPRAQPVGAEGDTNSPPAIGTSPLVRASAAVAYVVSATPVGAQSKMWMTTNGGASWLREVIRCAGRGPSVVLATDPRGAIFAVCGFQGSAGFQSKSVSSSTNRGATWHLYGRCDPESGQPYDRNAKVLCSGYLGQVVAPQAGSVFETGCRSPVYVSRDGGARWATVHPLMGNSAGGCVAQVDFVNETDGIVLGAANTGLAPPEIWKTTDGGRYWTAYLTTVR
jgi:hypothetical protein